MRHSHLLFESTKLLKTSQKLYRKEYHYIQIAEKYLGIWMT
ncbi:MAG: hypothetical protein QG594_1216 [Bacteroidota bacterium]|nr:hypothetical protein [Bacteroidota bacterium]